jgi:hypothetical protein
MIPYARFSNELDGPSEGIDTVSIWVNPSIINRFDDFHENGNIREAINCRFKIERDHRTGRFIKKNYFIDIQAEALDPHADILEQILLHLIKFVYEGTLKYFNNTDMPVIAHFLMENFTSFFTINSLDFYFDLKEGECVLMGNANPYDATRYSSDYPSSLKVYSKVLRQKHKNHIPHNQIEQMAYQDRIEFHLANGNCGYLDYRNLQGTFEVVFFRYLPQLARKWYARRCEVVQVPNLYKLPYAHHLRQIHDMAFTGHIPQYRELMKTPLRPKPE